MIELRARLAKWFWFGLPPTINADARQELVRSLGGWRIECVVCHSERGKPHWLVLHHKMRPHGDEWHNPASCWLCHPEEGSYYGGYPTSACGCVCHYFGGTTAGAAHPGMPCYCYQAQGPVIVTPPKFCPNCGTKL